MVIAITIVSYSDAQTSKADFRDFSWGSSLAEVQSKEKTEFSFKDKDDLLEYKDVVGGYDCKVLYGFNENDKLINGNYLFLKKYSNPQLYIQDYTIFKNLLIQKYAKPTLELENWNKNTPTGDKTNYGQAIADGNLTLSSYWETDRSYVKIILTAIDNHPSLQIHYTTKTLDELENKEQIKKALFKL